MLEFRKVFMALPKQKTSPGRRNKRRSHQRINMKSLGACKNCGAIHVSHHICDTCGFYGGKSLMAIHKED